MAEKSRSYIKAEELDFFYEADANIESIYYKNTAINTVRFPEREITLIESARKGGAPTIKSI